MEAKSEVSEPEQKVNVQKPVQEVQKENKVDSKSCCKPKPILFVLLALSFLLLFSVVFINSSKNSVNKTPPIIQPSPTPTSTPSEWKTYINKEYNFSFEYPKNWLLGEDQDKNAKVRGVPFIYLRPESQKVSDPTYGEVRVWLYKDMQPNYYMENKLCDSPGICASVKNTEKIFVSNTEKVEALRVKNIPGPLPSEEIIVTNGNQMIVFHFNYEGENYTNFKNIDSKKVFDWILSTFKLNVYSNTESPNSNSQFQQILKKYCKPMIGADIKAKVPYLYTINRSVLPVELNDAARDFRKEENLTCISASSKSMENGYATLFGVRIWEDISRQGYLFDGPLVIDSVSLLSKDPNVQLSAFLETAYYDQKNVMIRGRKTFRLKNGETIYVSIDRAIMNVENDPRIVKLNKEYHLNNPQISNEITIKSIYSIFRILQQKEIDLIDKIVDDLNTVTLKD